MSFLKKHLASLVAVATMLAGVFVYEGKTIAQVANPFLYYSMSMDGQPVATTPYDEIVAGPTTSQVQDEAQVPTPVYASGGCTTTPAIVGNPYAFTLTNGASGCSGSTITLTMPASAHKWVCVAHDVTSPTTTMVEQSGAASTTSVVLTNYTRTTGVALTWVASDVIIGSCQAY